ncbi:MAG TPA: hypothetical protein PKE25_01165 [Novosphingobium sp.]|nr:hypothetical protein [Novosphingobium sp.]
MTHRLNVLLLALLVLVALPAWWWLLDSPREDVAAKPLTLAMLRELAGTAPGAAPTSVDVEILARREEPATLSAAGAGLRFRRLAAMGYVLEVPGRGPLVIDPVAAPILGQPPESIDPKAMVRMRARAGQASLILSIRNPGALSEPVPEAVAPGVVVIPAAGGRMIFARLADGREALFTGEIAPLAASWLHFMPPSRWRGQDMAPETRREVQAWLRTIRQWHNESPDLVVLPGNDVVVVRTLVARDLAQRALP